MGPIKRPNLLYIDVKSYSLKNILNLQDFNYLYWIRLNENFKYKFF